MEYLILEGDYATQLAKAVRLHIADGWRPQGGVSVSIGLEGADFYYVFAQAMIKETSIGESKTG